MALQVKFGFAGFSGRAKAPSQPDPRAAGAGSANQGGFVDSWICGFGGLWICGFVDLGVCGCSEPLELDGSRKGAQGMLTGTFKRKSVGTGAGVLSGK